MRILLTGRAGFIGRNFIRFLHHNFTDMNITVVDNLSEDPNTFFEQGLQHKVKGFLTMDVASPIFADWASHWKFDLVIHCAAIVGGKLAQEQGPLVISRNLAIDQAIIGLVQKGLAPELIFFSSCAAYACLLYTSDAADE